MTAPVAPTPSECGIMGDRVVLQSLNVERMGAWGRWPSSHRREHSMGFTPEQAERSLQAAASRW